MEKSPVRISEPVDTGERIEGFNQRRVMIDTHAMKAFLREIADRFGIENVHALMMMGAAIGSASGIVGFVNDKTVSPEQRSEWINEIATRMSKTAADFVSETNLLRADLKGEA